MADGWLLAGRRLRDAVTSLYRGTCTEYLCNLPLIQSKTNLQPSPFYYSRDPLQPPPTKEFRPPGEDDARLDHHRHRRTRNGTLTPGFGHPLGITNCFSQTQSIEPFALLDWSSRRHSLFQSC
ncbi:predicted protein [Coccidioides posadasii str. Silveira]|uniref:Predicted protein n=1 Tax=Coccidioides posadasii (strain RMSCC 757 / Silveira) TaxID=443226 RepID=E9DA89_COCPS|nr:predicted protein [Coccidioides posadasii str. Silveira]